MINIKEMFQQRKMTSMLLDPIRKGTYSHYDGKLVAQSIWKNPELFKVHIIIQHPVLDKDLLEAVINNHCRVFCRALLGTSMEQLNRTGLLICYDIPNEQRLFDLINEWKVDSIERVKPGVIMLWWD